MKKKENKKMHTPRHRVIHNPIPTYLFSNKLHVTKKVQRCGALLFGKSCFVHETWISEVVSKLKVSGTSGTPCRYRLYPPKAYIDRIEK